MKKIVGTIDVLAPQAHTKTLEEFLKITKNPHTLTQSCGFVRFIPIGSQSRAHFFRKITNEVIIFFLSSTTFTTIKLSCRDLLTSV